MAPRCSAKPFGGNNLPLWGSASCLRSTRCSVREVNSWNAKPTMPSIPNPKWNGDGSVLSSRSRALQEIGIRDSRSDSRLHIFFGTTNKQLAQVIIKCFVDGEIYVWLQESARGCEIFLVQPMCPPANENLMELLVMIDAYHRASAKTITVMIPYFGCARVDCKTQGQESIVAKLVANMITKIGANRVLACDLHLGQAMGYFDIPIDHVYGQPMILDYLASKMILADNLVVVSHDVGGVARARAFAKKLSDAPLAIVDKRGQGHNVSEQFENMNGLPKC